MILINVSDMTTAATPSLSSALRILMIEDDEGDVFLVNEILKGSQARAAVPEFKMTVAGTLAEGLTALASATHDVILLDLNLPDSQGMETVRRVVERANTTPVIVLSNLNDEEMSIEAAKNGAQDFLMKGHVESMWLARIMRYAVARKAAIHDLQEQLTALRGRQPAGTSAADAGTPDGPTLRAALDLSPDLVLVFGPTGDVRLANTAAAALGGRDLPGLPAEQALRRLGVHLADGAPLADGHLPHNACAAGGSQDLGVALDRLGGGSPRPALMKAVPVSDGGGRVSAVVACITFTPRPR